MIKGILVNFNKSSDFGKQLRSSTRRLDIRIIGDAPEFNSDTKSTTPEVKTELNQN